MTKIYFTDGSVVTTKATTENGIKRVINRECQCSSCKEIPEDELVCYNWDADEEDFIAEHKDDCTIYQTFDSVCGMWEQPIDIVAVEEDVED